MSASYWKVISSDVGEPLEDEPLPEDDAEPEDEEEPLADEDESDEEDAEDELPLLEEDGEEGVRSFTRRFQASQVSSAAADQSPGRGMRVMFPAGSYAGCTAPLGPLMEVIWLDGLCARLWVSEGDWLK